MMDSRKWQYWRPKRLQGGPAKVKPTYFTHQNAQTRYFSTVLFYKKTGSYSQKYYKRKGQQIPAKPDDFTIEFY